MPVAYVRPRRLASGVELAGDKLVLRDAATVDGLTARRVPRVRAMASPGRAGRLGRRHCHASRRATRCRAAARTGSHRRPVDGFQLACMARIWRLRLCGTGRPCVRGRRRRAHLPFRCWRGRTARAVQPPRLAMASCRLGRRSLSWRVRARTSPRAAPMSCIASRVPRCSRSRMKSSARQPPCTR